MMWGNTMLQSDDTQLLKAHGCVTMQLKLCDLCHRNEKNVPPDVQVARVC